MVLLSVLLVVFGFAVFITLYYYRTVLTWIKDPATSDEEVADPRKRHAHGVGWRFLRLRGQGSGVQQVSHLQPPPPILPTYSSYHRHLAVQHQYQQNLYLEDPSSQRPWLATRGRNSRAWRQMRYHEQQQSRKQEQKYRYKQQQRPRGHDRELSISSDIEDSSDVMASSPKSPTRSETLQKKPH
ncbi:hypothetical protein J3B02_005186 [Coemansia erecta]|nr:hypothetical protein J3B02_005186 [Coemansia erecta]